ncbi:DUF2207 domain-containing protein [Bifidobacterium simiarum]|uniref:DUF2207 domain-containing protein n=1 Tax=Bifidobacterium simiarum TaxID=2045441 RepID=A0A2M9HFP6_9BIFI|nr:DUF2207 domain-containing protein [Bifidobacterium simiarum]PJM75645.1 hypothetical protein CSQ87_04295 [Bifidobacterium simiarum]
MTAWPRTVRVIMAGFAVASSVMMVVLFAVAGISSIGVRGSDEDLTLDSLHYDVRVQTNGDLHVSETWTVNMESREDDDGNPRPWHQLYRTFRSRPAVYAGIRDVSVTDLDSGTRFRHVDLPDPAGVGEGDYDHLAGSWYLTDTGDGSTELGWNITPTDHGTVRFRIDYTAANAITVLRDAGEFNWQFLDDSNGLYAKKVTGMILWPDSASRSTVRSWLHYAGGTSGIEITSVGALEFAIDEMPSRTALEVHAVFPKSLVPKAARHDDGRSRADVISSERAMAEAWQAKQEARNRRTIILCVASAVLLLGMLAWSVWSIRTSRRLSRYRGDMTYWRDDPGVSPAVAAKIDGLGGSASQAHRNGLSATMLSLAHKRWIGLTVRPKGKWGKQDVLITIRGAEGDDAGRNAVGVDRDSVGVVHDFVAATGRRMPLTPTEEALMDILRRAATEYPGPFTMTDLRSAVKHNAESFDRLFRGYDNQLAVEYGGSYSTTTYRYSLVPCAVTIGIGLLAMVGFLILDWPLIGIPVAILAAALGIVTAVLAKSELLTKDGLVVAGRVEGLKRYMLDFSDFSKRGVPDLSMWDFYMVYAAAFGISDVVAKQLRMLYPELSDESAMRDTWDSSPVMYSIFYSSVYGSGETGSASGAGAVSGLGSMDLGSMLSSNIADIQSVISSAQSSGSGSSGGSGFSGSGFGGSGFGGFSGGGGGGGMGGR